MKMFLFIQIWIILVSSMLCVVGTEIVVLAKFMRRSESVGMIIDQAGYDFFAGHGSTTGGCLDG